jgi:predicted molibdopterin-dependent oxidoreductase YjgC
LATREKIKLPAPCYKAKRRRGCCNACVVEISGKEYYACNTVPENGMEIIVEREDLIALRNERIKCYNERIKNEEQNNSSRPNCCSSKQSKSCCFSKSKRK